MTNKTPGQIAYDEDCRRRPKYHDKKPRKPWDELPDYAKESWERNPTQRWPAIDQTPAGQQHVLPGAEKATDATMAQRRADAPLRPKAIQRPCDAGLFGDDARQTDLF